jgi:superfamily II DNA or RNA helicase
MLSLKKYQQEVIATLEKYLLTIREFDRHRAKRAFVEITERPYLPIEDLDEVPYICFKVPTGGGKTLIATHAVDYIYRLYLTHKGKAGIVIWFTPSDAIRSQTLKKLKNRNHPYREVLDAAFANYVKVFDSEEALRITKNDLDNYLCVLVETLQAFRRENTESLRNYRANGQLMTHFESVDAKYFDILDKYEGTAKPVESLTNVIRMNEPLIVIDEGHNVKTDLSYDMLRELNPSFIMEYTATPLEGSNVLISIGADKLKAEHMVKIPIYVAPYLNSWKIALDAAVDRRNELEEIAKAEQQETGEYIRPIMLIQAQNKSKYYDTITIDAVKDFLLSDKSIPKHYVAIRDSEHHEIDNIDLFDPNCEIRYIITVKALGEGWDCPFASVLASVAHKRSTLDVAQILGRILRLPNAEEKLHGELNVSYVFTSSSDTEKTLQNVVKALQGYGYDEYALRRAGVKGKPEKTYFDKIVDDEDVIIPLVALRQEDGSYKPLTYRPDLVRGFSLAGEAYKTEIDVNEMITRIYEVDVRLKEGETRVEAIKVEEIPAKVELSFFPDPKADLVAEVSRSIQFPNISLKDITKYVSRVINLLVESQKATLEQLIYHRYKLALVIKDKIQSILDGYAQARFETFRNEKKLGICPSFVLPSRVEIFLHEETEYNKHFYERAYLMDSEEKIFASRLDSLENVRWWLRNIERSGFYLQGYRKGRFFPDFVVKTKRNNYFIVEYKGEYLLGTADTRYEEEIGEIWQNLAPENYFFRLIGKDKINEVVDFLSNK